MNMKKIIFTTDVLSYEYSDYVEHCKGNGVEPSSEDSQDFWDWVYEMIEFDMDDAYTNIDCKSDKNTTVVITGSLGLWNGRPDIEPVFVESESIFNSKTKQRIYDSALKLAIQKCGEGMNDVECYLDDETGCVEVIGHHHDGTNHFYIYKLSEFGRKAKEDAEDNEEDYNVTEEWFDKFTEEDLY
jgi:hypothetical protein